MLSLSQVSFSRGKRERVGCPPVVVDPVQSPFRPGVYDKHIAREWKSFDAQPKYMAQRRRARARTLRCRQHAPGAAYLAPTTHRRSMASNNPRGGSMGLQGPPYAVLSPLVTDPLAPPGDPESSLFLTCHFVRKGTTTTIESGLCLTLLRFSGARSLG